MNGPKTELETWLMTDQPPTCPKCGRRVICLEGCGTTKQVVQCPGCQYKYRLEDDGELE